MSFLQEVARWFTAHARWSGDAGIPARLLEHVELSALAVAIAAALALPLALWIGHARRLEFLVVSILNVGRAIPTLGILIFFVILFGIGLRPILIAMVALAIPPILTNTYVGIQSVSADTLEAARGMGLRERQVLARIEIPLAAPLIVAGLRTAAVQVVATATLGALIAGNNLGRFIIDGFATGDDPQIFGGALLVAALAIVVEIGFGLLERIVSPRTSSVGRRRAEPLAGLESARPAT